MKIMLLYLGRETLAASAGTERVFVNMANAMAERGHQVIAVTNDYEDVVPFYPLSKNVKLVKLGNRKLAVPLYIKVRREINRIFPHSENTFVLYRVNITANKLQKIFTEKPDVVVAYEHEGVLVANRLYGDVPRIAMVHFDISTYFRRMDKYSLAEENKITLHQVLMPSYVEASKKYLTGKVVYIPNTVAEVENTQQAALSGSKKVYTIIFVGRLEPDQKRPHILVEAFAALASKYPNWQVKIFGKCDDNVYKKQMEKIVKDNGLEQKIFFCGISNKIKDELLQADIFAIPSAYEGFGMAHAEAMALGLPSIGFASAPSVNELIIEGVNGLLCEDGMENYAQGLAKLMDNQSLRCTMGQMAKQMSKDYEPKTVCDKWEKTFSQLIP